MFLPPTTAASSWLRPKNKVTVEIPKRCLAPICGPPRFHFSPMQKLIFGGGSMLIMMIIPVWGLLSVPAWAAKSQGKRRVANDGEE
uniref:Uncharacterized protein n=1 Tax=Musca domestica TaxID=7370 RepID=A0A1I8N729_MUSDO